jgi:hypothetical protein
VEKLSQPVLSGPLPVTILKHVGSSTLAPNEMIILLGLTHHSYLDAHEAHARFVLQARQRAAVEWGFTAADRAVPKCANAKAARSATRYLF